MNAPIFRTIAASRRTHASLHALRASFCGRALDRHPQRQDLTAEEALARTDCRTCRKSFHPDLLREDRELKEGSR